MTYSIFPGTTSHYNNITNNMDTLTHSSFYVSYSGYIVLNGTPPNHNSIKLFNLFIPAWIIHCQGNLVSQMILWTLFSVLLLTSVVVRTTLSGTKTKSYDFKCKTEVKSFRSKPVSQNRVQQIWVSRVTETGRNAIFLMTILQADILLLQVADTQYRSIITNRSDWTILCHLPNHALNIWQLN